MNETPLSQELDNIVEECLDAIQRGEATLEDCLRRYPEAAAELKPLLQIALLTTRLKAPQMSAERVQALDKRLRTAMPPPANRPQTSIRLWQPFVRLAAALLLITVLALGSGAGLVSASENTLPGDTLYPVKRVWESARVTFAPAGQQDDVMLDVARNRLDEVIRLDQQQRLDQKAMVDLYTATALVIRRADAETMPAVLVYAQEVQLAMTGITPTPAIQPVYNDVWLMTTIKSDGTLPYPPELPPSQQPDVVVATVTPAFELTADVTSAATVEVTVEATAEATAEASEEATEESTAESTEGTATPRIPPTATRTPTATPTATATPTGTLPSPTPTLTAPPIGVTLPIGGGTLPPNVTATALPQTPVLPTVDATIPIRDTQRAVYATQTAGPPLITPSSP